MTDTSTGSTLAVHHQWEQDLVDPELLHSQRLSLYLFRAGQFFLDLQSLRPLFRIPQRQLNSAELKPKRKSAKQHPRVAWR
jgi:hypothetical protein